MDEANYNKPLHECYDILSNADNINYVLCVCDSANAKEGHSLGGQAWNINTDNDENQLQPDFETMVGNLIEQYLENNELPYSKKIAFVRQFANKIIEHITFNTK